MNTDGKLARAVGAHECAAGYGGRLYLEKNHMKWRSLVPELVVSDFQKSLHFYVSVLGFAIKYKREDPSFAYLEFKGSQIMIVEGIDRVAWQRTFQGTHQTAFKGFPASGRSIVWRDMVTSHFLDGLIVEEWVVTDLAERLLLSRKK